VSEIKIMIGTGEPSQTNVETNVKVSRSRQETSGPAYLSRVKGSTVTQRVTSRHLRSLLPPPDPRFGSERSALAARSGSGHSLLHALNSYIRSWLPRRRRYVQTRISYNDFLAGFCPTP
jgi:hypothetical protein